jgi:hypothetical protein
MLRKNSTIQIFLGILESLTVQILFFFAIVAVFSSCTSTKFLKEGETFYTGAEIEPAYGSTSLPEHQRKKKACVISLKQNWERRQCYSRM